MRDLFIIIMAGGLGKRMNSSIPKVLHCINNKPMLVHIIETSNRLNPKKILLVVGKYKDIIESTIKNYINIQNIEFINQPNALGTGNAILCCRDYLLNNPLSNVLILSGDVPLIRCDTLSNIINISNTTIVTTSLDNPTGYGRIIILDSIFHKIIEEKDCNDREKELKIVNSGIYLFDSDLLCKYLPLINNDNNQKEYYLTDIFKIIKTHESRNINLYNIEKKFQYQLMGVNTPEQLKDLEILMQS